jgi:sugar phosphate isomerase/epimerase
MTALQTDLTIAARLRTMKFGYTSGMYPVPAGISEDDQPLWHLRRAAELGCSMLQLTSLPENPQVREAFRAEAADRGLTLEGNALAIFVPLGTTPGSNADALREQLTWARECGMSVVRAGYGQLTLETTRFAPERNTDAQLEHVAACLTAAAPVAEEVGLPIAIENHCDFTGQEVAQVLRAVGSEWVGCALDTANGFTVFCDPNDDIEALAEFTFTTHMKDMKMVPTPLPGTIPILPRGCRLGEGHVDFRRALLLLAERSPKAEGLHLVVEAGWETFDAAAENAQELKQALLEQGVGYLRELVQSLVDEA